MELASPDATEKTKKRKKPLEQSVPHRVIEKRRRDRINKSLEQIRAMLPVSRTQRVRNDKVDVLTATIDYLQELQQAVGSATTSNGGYDNKTSSSSSSSDEQLSPPVTDLSSPPETTTTIDDYRWYGFRHCIAEAKRFLVDEEKFDVAADGIVARLVEHLEKRAPPPPPPPSNGRRNDRDAKVAVLPAAVLKTSDGGGAVSMPTPENVQNLNGLELISRIAQDQLRSESSRASGGGEIGAVYVQAAMSSLGTHPTVATTTSSADLAPIIQLADIAAILPQGDGVKKEEGGVVGVPTASQPAAYCYWPPSYVAAAAAANNWK